jgi:hypothetical protein
MFTGQWSIICVLFFVFVEWPVQIQRLQSKGASSNQPSKRSNPRYKVAVGALKHTSNLQWPPENQNCSIMMWQLQLKFATGN